jgi:hypothetical protein
LGFLALSQTETQEKDMSSYSTIRNTGLAAVLVATFAGIVSNGLALDQKIIYERDILTSSSAVILPEVVVIATRLAS